MSKPEAETLPRVMVARVEAALYASGRPLDAEELARVAGTASQRKATAIARDIAKAMKCSEGTVRSRLFYALTKLRPKLAAVAKEQGFSQ